MITDKETNILYVADSLLLKYPKFYKDFERNISENKIDFRILNNTKDVWCRDYMPVQVTENKFVQFDYNPDYIRNDENLWHTISDVSIICKNLLLKPVKSDLVIDGGNVIKGENCVIMCNKVFAENPKINEKKLINELENLFEVERVFFVPWDYEDFTGHADGMVRFLDDKTVLINRYSKNDEIQHCLKTSLHNAGFDWEEIPYNPYSNKKDDAKGIYINYLQLKGILIIPVFGIKEDDIALKKFERLFTQQKIVSVRSEDVAKEGGILNCISWNIKSEN